MAERKNIALYLLYGDWMGGVYYVKNLINSLNLLASDQQPNLFLIYSKGAKIEEFQQLNYARIKYSEYPATPALPLQQRGINLAYRLMSGKNYYDYRLKADYAFPCEYDTYKFFNVLRPGFNPIYWVHDFQDEYLPQFFPQDELDRRKKFRADIASSNEILVLSSEDAKADFEKFYPKHSCKVHVLRFCTFSKTESENSSLKGTLEKFKINVPYFFIPNQFWAHKNHITVLKAVTQLKSLNLKYHVVFSGKTQDYRQPDYFKSLQKFVTENGIEEYVTFAGFVETHELMDLFSASAAVIQPSLFEGWSTTVEIAKELGKLILLSDLRVHKEQMGANELTHTEQNENGIFFSREDEAALAELMRKVLSGVLKPKTIDYTKNQKGFANDFLELITKFE